MSAPQPPQPDLPDPLTATAPPLEPNPACAQLLELLLREPAAVVRWLRDDASPRALARLAALTLLVYAVYGALVGGFSGGEQIYLAPLKLAGGAVFCGAICLPSFLVFVNLSGGRVRLGQALGLLVVINALTALVLVGFVPVAWVFTNSVSSLAFMAAIHFCCWAVALYFGLRILPGGLSQFRASAPHYLKLWIAVFLITLFQTTTALRPLLAPAETALPQEKKFFLTHWVETLGLQPKWK